MDIVWLDDLFQCEMLAFFPVLLRMDILCSRMLSVDLENLSVEECLNITNIGLFKREASFSRIR